jgi:hypothetical protein
MRCSCRATGIGDDRVKFRIDHRQLTKIPSLLVTNCLKFSHHPACLLLFKVTASAMLPTVHESPFYLFKSHPVVSNGRHSCADDLVEHVAGHLNIQLGPKCPKFFNQMLPNEIRYCPRVAIKPERVTPS